MKSPQNVQELLTRRYLSNRKAWLARQGTPAESADWPMTVPLGIPTEAEASLNPESVKAWAAAWGAWRGRGRIEWGTRAWRMLGAQRLPERLVLGSPEDVAHWAGELPRWLVARARYTVTADRRPALRGYLSQHFDMLADYPEDDFDRLLRAVDWLMAHPHSGVYLRQLPIEGLDTKWLGTRMGLMAALLGVLRDGQPWAASEFMARAGLRQPPELIRIRVLDPALRALAGGLSDISAPLDDLAVMPLAPARVLVVENLQTGLALPDIPGTVVVMGLGYRVDVLAAVPWATGGAEALYWGDLDSHGFSILSRARAHLPQLRSLLMDEATLLEHESLWVAEPKPCISDLGRLTPGESEVYDGLRFDRWGAQVRLEQERIGWGWALPRLLSSGGAGPAT